MASHLASVLGRLPVTCATGELLALVAAQPWASQGVLQLIPQNNVSLNMQSTSARALFTAVHRNEQHNASDGVVNSITNNSSSSSSSKSKQRWESYSFAAAQAVTQQQQQQQRVQPLWHMQGERSELEKSILMCPSLKALAAVVSRSQPLPAPAVVLAVNRLKALHKQRVRHSREQQQQQEVDQQQQQQQQLQEEVLQQLTARLEDIHSQLLPVHVVQVLHCYGQLGQFPASRHALLAALLQQLVGNVASLQPHHLPILATAIAELSSTSNQEAKHYSSGSGSGINMEQQRQQQDDTPTAAAASEKAAESARQVLAELCRAVQHLPAAALDAAGVTRLVGALARLGHYDWQTMRHLAGMATAYAHSMGPSQLATLLVGCAKLHHYDQELCSVLAAAAEACMGQATGQQVVQMTWALAHLKHDQPGVFAAAAQQAVAHAADLQPRHISNLAWAFAVRKAYSGVLYDALADRILQLGPQVLEPHHCSIIAWSFAKQGHRSEAVLGVLADRAAAMVDAMLPQNISNLAWAYGRLSYPHPKLFSALATAAKSCCLDGFTGQNLTDLAWGCAATGHQDPELFEIIARATMTRMRELSPHSLADLTWAFAASRQPSAPTVLGAAAAAAAASLDRFSLGMLADMMWSYAAVGVRDDELLAAAAKVLPLRSLSLEHDTEAQAKVLWGLKTLNYRDEVLEAQLADIIPNVKELLDN